MGRMTRSSVRNGPLVVFTAVVGAVTLIVTGCSDSEDSPSATVAETPADTSPVDELGADATTTTLSDAEYEEAVERYRAAIAESASDPCALAEVVTSPDVPPPASSSAQMRLLLSPALEILRAMGASSDSQEVREGFAAMADELEAEAEAKGYPSDLLLSPDALTGEQAGTTFAAWQEEIGSECFQGGNVGPEDVPEG